MSEIHFDEWSTKKEVVLRGVFATLSADMELSIVRNNCGMRSKK